MLRNSTEGFHEVFFHRFVSFAVADTLPNDRRNVSLVLYCCERRLRCRTLPIHLYRFVVGRNGPVRLPFPEEFLLFYLSFVANTLSHWRTSSFLFYLLSVASALRSNAKELSIFICNCCRRRLRYRVPPVLCFCYIYFVVGCNGIVRLRLYVEEFL